MNLIPPKSFYLLRQHLYIEIVFSHASVSYIPLEGTSSFQRSQVYFVTIRQFPQYETPPLPDTTL